ncbi:MAG: DUF2029 domain-containing protein [Anaerolineales bacterium]|nr:DUF2029 domain-containing protein [Anaerolineales bacterium]
MNQKQKISWVEVLALALISVQIFLYTFMWLRLLNDPSIKTMDFISFYTTGRLMRMGEYQQIYNLDSQALIQNQIIGESSAPLIFAHPPHLNFLLAFIANENYVSSYMVWSLFNMFVLLICAALIKNFFIKLNWDVRSAWLGAMASITFFPTFISILGGQDTVYTLLGLLLWMFGLLNAKEMKAGFGLALATLSPTIAGALTFPLFASQRRAGIWFVIGILLLTLHAFLLLGLQGIKDFIHLLGINSEAQVYGLDWSKMYNLLGLLIRSFPNADTNLIRTIAWSVAGISIFVICIWWWKKDITVKHIGIAVLLGTFTAPHLYLHGVSYLLLPLLGMMVLLHEVGKQTVALLLAPMISTLLIIILLLIPNWDFHIYYLLMLALFLGFIFLKNSNSIEDKTL